MARLLRSATLRLRLGVALTLAAAAVTLEPLMVRASGSRAPAWSHWWCSASAAQGGASHGGGGSRGAPTALLTPLKALLPHWPHFLPLLLGLGTLVYLWRANARFHLQETQARAARHDLATAATAPISRGSA